RRPPRAQAGQGGARLPRGRPGSRGRVRHPLAGRPARRRRRDGLDQEAPRRQASHQAPRRESAPHPGRRAPRRLLVVKLAVNVALSLIMLVVCVWAIWPADPGALEAAFRKLSWASFWPYLLGYLGLLAVTHFCRAWRWNNLLAPINVRLSPGRLLAISSVGFMAILALPARLGEFVRPALIRQKGKVSAAAALGTVAVERIVDGLLVSIFVFAALFARRGPDAPGWMMPTAWAALAVFAAATVFLVFALRWPDRTVKTAVAMTLARRFSPKLADKLEEKLHSMIRGFFVLKDAKNLIVFLLWSLAYWIANGFSLWV